MNLMSMTKLKWWVRINFKSIRLLNKLRLLTTRQNSYLYQKGWTKTILNGFPCDFSGKAIPWMNFSFIHFIQDRISKNHLILEFGGGYSTIFWALRCKKVFGIEHDNFFVDKISPKLPKNGRILVPASSQNQEYEEMGTEAFKLNEERKFDIIVIDGMRRNQCFSENIKYLKHDGVVIWDDSSRESYQQSFEILKSIGFKSISFEGLKPGDRSIDETTVFYRKSNCLRI